MDEIIVNIIEPRTDNVLIDITEAVPDNVVINVSEALKGERGLIITTIEPSNPNVGDLWIDTN